LGKTKKIKKIPGTPGGAGSTLAGRLGSGEKSARGAKSVQGAPLWYTGYGPKAPKIEIETRNRKIETFVNNLNICQKYFFNKYIFTICFVVKKSSSRKNGFGTLY